LALCMSLNPKVHYRDGHPDIRVCSKRLAAFLLDNFRTGSMIMRFPAWIFGLTKRKAFLILSYLFKGDAYDSKDGRKHYATISPSLALVVRMLLLKHGVISYIAKEKGRDSDCFDQARK
jgi:hypothetical protein